MRSDQNIQDFMASWDADSIEVFRRMDGYDAVDSMPEEDRNRIVGIGIKVFENLEQIADGILNSPLDKRDNHLDALLLILAFSPTTDSMSYLKGMMAKRPDIYNVLFASVMNQQPLLDSGKIIRQRILFFMRRTRVLGEIYGKEVSLAVIAALESYRRPGRDW